jgi:hypothetical protein
MAGAVEETIRVVPLDNTTHMGAGCGYGNDGLRVGGLFTIITIVADYIADHGI